MLKNMQKHRRLRFSNYDDLVLLQEVVKGNPYENGWKNVREAVVRLTGKEFNTRCLREHVQYLLKLHSREDYGTRRKSGTEEECALKEELIQQLKGMLKAMGRKYGRKRVQDAVGDGLENREDTVLYISNDFVQASPNITLGVVENSEDTEQLTSNQSTSNQSSTKIRSSGKRLFHPRGAASNHLFVSMLKEKQEREAAHEREIISLKKQKLQLEREKLQLEKDKFEQERKKMEFRLEIERKELDQRILREKRQQDIIDALLSIIKK